MLFMKTEIKLRIRFIRDYQFGRIFYKHYEMSKNGQSAKSYSVPKSLIATNMCRRTPPTTTFAVVPPTVGVLTFCYAHTYTRTHTQQCMKLLKSESKFFTCQT